MPLSQRKDRDIPQVIVSSRTTQDSTPLAWSFGNARWTTIVTAAGTGVARYGQQDITRWRCDPTSDSDGYFLFVRDLDRGNVWGLTLQPLPHDEGREHGCEFYPSPSSGKWVCLMNGIRSAMRVVVPADSPLELRSIRLTNESDLRRRLEVISYAELVLQASKAFESHPAFSKMFIETSWDSERQSLVARRRPRSPEECTLSSAMFVAGDAVAPLDMAQLQTSRIAFLGRGNTLRSAQALRSKAPLPGVLGGVLDPIFSVRIPLVLEAGQSHEIVIGLAASDDPDELTHIVTRYREPWTLQECLSHPIFPSQGLSTYDTDSTRAGIEECSAARRLGRELYGLNPPQVLPPRSELIALGALSDSWPCPVPEVPSARTNPALKRSSSTTLSRTGPADQPLLFENPWGGFAADGRSYRIALKPGPGRRELLLPPMPWTHILANENAGCIVSERGTCCTWVGNSRENRLTPWFNDPVSDPHGEALYVQDIDSAEVWSPLPGPLPQVGCTYEVEYRFGSATYMHEGNGLRQSVEVFVPLTDPIKITTWRLTNVGDQPRHLRLFGYLQWVLGEGVVGHRGEIETAMPRNDIVLARRSNRAHYSSCHAFARWCSDRGLDHLVSGCDRLAFLGRFGSMEFPAALRSSIVDHASRDEWAEFRPNLDPAAVFQQSVTLAAGETLEVALLIGETPSKDMSMAHSAKYGSNEGRAEALAAVQAYWLEQTTRLTITTPSPALNLLMNGWLAYQNIVCRFWGRSSFYQGGGAFGFRDQLQDSLALMHQQPDRTRKQILLHAAHQFVEGDVLHWWHPPADQGVRTRFSDDLHWLPYAALEYVKTTGDDGIWNEVIPYLEAPCLRPDEQERFLQPVASGESGTLWDHCCRALDRANAVGLHGLPLMGCGDWNDGMSRVGAAGRGESIWLAFFLCPILKEFAEVCEQRGSSEASQRYRLLRDQFMAAIKAHAWDGSWYRRAYLDDGTPLGSQGNSECQIDALVQAWSVLSAVAPLEKAKQALQEVEDRLVDVDQRLIRLLYPAFRSDRYDVGYIRGYIPGIRENGGQYTHGVLWFIRALAELGQGTKACDYLEMLTPMHHTRTEAEIATYQTEPYVVAADVYGEPPHVGRGGWTWYTGSAGWMYRVVLESLLGIRLRHGESLEISPRIATHWKEFSVRYVIPGSSQTRYCIQVRNSNGHEHGIKDVYLDGALLSADLRSADGRTVLVPLAFDGAEHQIRVEM